MKLKQLSLSDTKSLAITHALCFEGSDCWSEDQIKGSLLLETTIGFGIEEDGILTAFVLAQKAGDEAEVLTICALPSWRGRGLAKELLTRLFELQGLKSVFLEVAEDNAAALALYERVGFVVIGRREAYYKRDQGAVAAINYRYEIGT